MDFEIAALWFLIGATASHLISKLLGLYHGVFLLQEMEKFVAVYLTALVKDVRVFLLHRSEQLQKSGTMTKEDLEKVKLSDAATIILFKEVVLYKLRKCAPKYYLPYLKYSNWEELEEYANRIQSNKEQS